MITDTACIPVSLIGAEGLYSPVGLIGSEQDREVQNRTFDPVPVTSPGNQKLVDPTPDTPVFVAGPGTFGTDRSNSITTHQTVSQGFQGITIPRLIEIPGHHHKARISCPADRIGQVDQPGRLFFPVIRSGPGTPVPGDEMDQEQIKGIPSAPSPGCRRRLRKPLAAWLSTPPV